MAPATQVNIPMESLPAELLATKCPVVSVYFATPGAAADAPQQIALRWKSLRRRLSDGGAPAETLAAVDPLVNGAHLHGRCLTVIADIDGPRLVAYLPEEPPADPGGPSGDGRTVAELGVVGELPHLVPLYAFVQGQLPHIVVAADRKGAEILAVLPDGPDIHRTVSGQELHITRSAPGGWSQRRFQQRAENTWEANAGQVAEAVTRLADATGPRMVVVSGDVRAVAFLREQLPVRVADLVVEVEGEYPSLAEVSRRADQLVAERSRRDTAELLAQFAGAADPLRARGADDTLGALARGQARTVFLDTSACSGREAWFGPRPQQAAATAEALTVLGVDRSRPAPLVDVVTRACAGTDAAVRIVPAGASELAPAGIGALLRYS